MRTMKSAFWILMVTTQIFAVLNANAANLNKSDVDSELSTIVNSPIASKKDVDNFAEKEKARVKALGEANVKKINALREKSKQATKDSSWRKVIDLNQEIIAIDSNNFLALAALDYAYMMAGDTDKALEYCAKVLKKLRWDATYTVVAASYAKKGEKDKAFLWLKKAYDSGYMFKTTKQLKELFPKYLDDPKFELPPVFRLPRGGNHAARFCSC